MRKAQTSVFILIGVIVLLIVAILVSQLDEASQSFDTERIISEQVPEEFAVLKQYVEKCLEDTTREGLERLGSQGGRIDPAKDGLVANRYFPTEGDGVYLSDYSDIFIPYWFYMSSDNDCDGYCQFDSNKLLLESDNEYEQTVQTELEDYIKTGVYECVANFNSLQEVGLDVSQNGVMEPTVYFRQEDVRVYLDFPLTVTNDLDTVTVSQYETVIDVPFRKLFEEASILTQLFADTRYFEAVTLNLISSYSGTRSSELPPFFSSTTNPVETAFWLTPQVHDKIVDMNTIYMNSIQLDIARNYEEYGDRSATDLYRFLTIPLNFTGDERDYYQHRYDDFTFNTIYKPEWNIFFELNDGQQVIRPSSLYVSLFSFMALNEFRTQYSISYPIVVSVSDPDALGQDGFSLNFAIEPNIRYNSALESDFERNTFLLDAIELNQDDNVETMFCDNDQKNSKPVNGTLIDLSSNETINDAIVTYACGPEACQVGYSNTDGYFEYDFPVCMGGYLAIFKHGYQTEILPLSTSIENEKDMGLIELTPVQTINVSLYKKLFVRTLVWEDEYSQRWEWVFSNETRDIKLNEVGLITLTQVGVPSYVQPHVATIALDGKSDINTLTEIQLVPGIYEVEGTLTDVGGFSIPSDRRCKDDECATIPEIDLDARISAGVYLNPSSTYLVVDEDTLYNSTELVLYAAGYDLDSIPYVNRKVEDLNYMGKEEAIFATHMDDLMPEFN